MACIPRSSRPCRVALNTVGTVSSGSGSWYDLFVVGNTHMIRANDVFRRRCFSSSSGEPPSSGNETQKESRRQNNNNNNNNNRYSHSHSHNNHPKETKTTQQQQRWPKQKQKHRNQRDEWKPKRNNEHRRRKQDRFPSLVQSSQYAYAVRSINAASSASPSDPNSNPNSRSARGNTNPTTAAANNNNNTSNADANAVRTLRSVNAAALLDPLAYCKGSTKLSAHAKVGGKSISGTDAARRLLKGKREVLEAARELGTAPVLLEGHGVPPALFQHCVDLGAALLEHYGPETVECSFHNYEQEQEHDAQTQTHTHTHSHPTTNRPNTDRTRKTPLHVRVRRRDGTNACLPPPLASEIDPTDWDYNLALYLTVMERLAKCLGPVLESFPSRDDASPYTGNAFASFRHSRNGNGNDVAHHHDGVPPVSSQPQPRWNVDVLEGAYFDFRPIGESSNRIPNENKNTKVTANESDNRAARGRKSDGFCPFPVVEFLPQHGIPPSQPGIRQWRRTAGFATDTAADCDFGV
eukprot:jgi/Psemu1/39956/gm1.39956_g